MDVDFSLDRIRSLVVTLFYAKVVAALDSAVQSGRIRLSATLVEV